MSLLLKLQFKKLGLSNAKVVVLDEPTTSQAETVYRTVNCENIEGAIFVKDPDGYFCGDFTIANSIAIYPLDKLEMVNPRNKSYVELDDQFYITNIIEKKSSAVSLMQEVIFLMMLLCSANIMRDYICMNNFLCRI